MIVVAAPAPEIVRLLLIASSPLATPQDPDGTTIVPAGMTSMIA
ncbi:MAG TPA: hypothetical protein VMJ65_02190 [Solirubrobacteraceae bacterium]|nr:hypothetical protein [Solirubrobacteraceae bacterium]